MKRVRLLIISAWAMISTGLQAQETAEMVFPQAEWSKTGDTFQHHRPGSLYDGEQSPECTARHPRVQHLRHLGAQAWDPQTSSLFLPPIPLGVLLPSYHLITE